MGYVLLYLGVSIVITVLVGTAIRRMGSDE